MNKEKHIRRSALSKNPAPALPKPLVEEAASFSRIFKELLLFSGWKKEPETNAAPTAALKFLKRHGFLDQRAVSDKESIENLLEKTAIHLIELVNSSGIDDRDMLSLAESKAVKIHHGEHYFLAVEKMEETGKNPQMEEMQKIVVAELEKFKSTSIYLAHMCVSDELFGMQINHGKHRGYLAGFCPRDGDRPFLFFKHVEHGQGLHPKNRIEFIEQVLSNTGLVCRIEEKSGGGCDLRAFGYGGPDWKATLSSLVRLSRSVKDLDMNLPTKASAKRAVALFNSGVTNMLEALTYLDGVQRQLVKCPDSVSNISEDEKIIVNEMARSLSYIAGYVDWARDRHDAIRRAKDLNFSIIQECTKLQFLLFSCSEGTGVQKKEVNASFRLIREQLLEMARICDGKYVNHKNLFLRKAEEVMGRFGSEISKISSWVLDYNDRTRLMALFDAKKGKLALGDVKTIEEMVRFLHADILSLPRGSNVGFERNDVLSGRLFFFDGVEQLAKRFLCFNLETGSAEKEPELRALLRSVVKDADQPGLLGEGRACAIVGRDFAEISFPMGKHYAEVDTEVDHKSSRYILRMRYIDTEYSNAPNRRKFVESALAGLGFGIRYDEMEKYNHNRAVVATLDTQGRKQWEKAYCETVRLMLSVQDLDLFSTDAESMLYLFSKGFTNITAVAAHYNEFVAAIDASSPEIGELYSRILKWDYIGNGDKRAFTDAFMERFEYDPSRILPFIKDFPIEDLDTITLHVIGLEHIAKGKEDKTREGQLKRLGDTLDKLIQERERRS